MNLNRNHSTSYLCSYVVNTTNSTIDKCRSDQCNRFLDPYSIMVKPKSCKTKLLYLSFSSYKKFSLFLHRIKWKLGSLFSSSLKNGRQLRIYIDQIDNDDRPVSHNELIRLGVNIDLYELYIKKIPKPNHLDRLIRYDTNNPEWCIIKVKLYGINPNNFLIKSLTCL